MRGAASVLGPSIRLTPTKNNPQGTRHEPRATNLTRDPARKAPHRGHPLRPGFALLSCERIATTPQSLVKICQAPGHARRRPILSASSVKPIVSPKRNPAPRKAPLLYDHNSRVRPSPAQGRPALSSINCQFRRPLSATYPEHPVTKNHAPRPLPTRTPMQEAPHLVSPPRRRRPGQAAAAAFRASQTCRVLRDHVAAGRASAIRNSP